MYFITVSSLVEILIELCWNFQIGSKFEKQHAVSSFLCEGVTNGKFSFAKKKNSKIINAVHVEFISLYSDNTNIR